MNKNKFLSLFIPTILVINQIIFILLPYTLTRAQIITNTYTKLEPSITNSIIYPDLKVSLISLPSYVSQPVSISAQTNITPDQVIFYLNGPQTAKFNGENRGNNTYSFYLNPNELLKGTYTLTVRAVKGDKSASISANITLKNYSSTSITNSLPYYSTTSTIYPITTPQTITNNTATTTTPISSSTPYNSTSTETNIPNITTTPTENIYNTPTTTSSAINSTTSPPTTFTTDLTNITYPVFPSDTTSTTQEAQTSTTTNVLPQTEVKPINLEIKFNSLPSYLTNAVYVYAQTNILADKVIFHLNGPQQSENLGIYKGNNIYVFYCNPQNFIDGNYILIAKAILGDKSSEISANIVIKKNVNSESINDNDKKITSSTIENLNNLQPLEITFLETLEQPLSGDVSISAGLNKQVDKVYFTITNDNFYYKYPAIKDDFNRYHFIWYTKQFPNQYYKVTAIALIGENKFSKSFSSQIINVTNNKTGKATSSPYSLDENSNVDLKNIEIIFIEKLLSPYSTDQKISINVNQTIDKVYFLLEGPAFKKYEALKDENTYYFNFPFSKLPNGKYQLSAIAIKNNLNYSKYIDIEVKNHTTDKTISEKEIKKIPLECIKIGINSLEECEKFTDSPLECRSKNLVGKSCGEYLAVAPECRENGIISLSDCNKYLNKNNFLKTAEEDEIEKIKEPIVPEILPECKEKKINSPEECKNFMSLAPECRDKGITDKEVCKKYKLIHPECRDKDLSEEECSKYLNIPSECRKNGILIKEDCEKYLYKSTLPSECKEVKITTLEECGKFLLLKNMPQICREKKVSTKEECNKILEIQAKITPECKRMNISDGKECNKYMDENFMPKECLKQGILSKEECDYILRNKSLNLNNLIKIEPSSTASTTPYFKIEEGMPKECQGVGIITVAECEKIILNKGLPQECQTANAKTKEECDKIMFLNNAPKECREANITEQKECEKYLLLLKMPLECREEKVTDIEECKKILFRKNAPKECLDAGLEDSMSCEKFMFKKYAHPACIEAGILTSEACKIYMFEQFSNKENIAQSKFPIECEKAGVKTAEECEKIIKKLYLPKECQDQGIKDEKECKTYLDIKNLPIECQKGGAKSKQECAQVMLKKYASAECQNANITEGEECKNFIFAKYGGDIDCQGLDEWECKNSIKEKHLGNIIAKQAQFKELKEKVSHLAGESLKVDEFEKKLDLAKELIPITTKKETGIKIIQAEEKLILNEADNLIKTAPIALMIDSDGDGIPDDVEKRLGTSYNNADSDGDGYDDGVEIKGNFNPLGSGELKLAVSSIDQAILENKILGQPKTEGIVSEKLAIENIINKIDKNDKKNNGYNLSGKAEPNSVVTLYIYSDLPLVITAKTDEYGNWNYELDESLIEGEHEIYVAINDNTGKVISKSNPLTFFVKEAKAISVKDFVSSSASAQEFTTPIKKTESLIMYYIIIAIFIIAIGIILFIFFLMQIKKQVKK